MVVSTTALAQYDAPKLAAALERAQARIHALEQENGALRQENSTLRQENGALRQEIKWRDQLDAVPATVMSQNQKAALKVTLQAIQHKTPDTDGLVQIESWHLCKKAGMSKGTFLDHLAYCAELGILRKRTEQVRDPDSQQVIATNYFVGTTELTASPSKYQAPQPRNHGGARPRCKNPACRSERLQKRTIKRTIITCLDCGEVQSNETDDQTVMLTDHLDQQFDHTADTVVVESTLEPQGEHHAPGQNVDLPTYKTNVLERQLDVPAISQQEPHTPPMGGEGIILDQREPACQAQPVDPHDLLRQAAQLLVDIAGPEPRHIDMSSVGPNKYYPVHRAFTVQDARAHLKGWKTKGASLHHPGGMTRALCYDADHADTWEHLLDAARFLAEAGYHVLVEDSPVGRGGHLWIIYTGLVNAAWAHRHALEIAPMLHQIKEAWPGTHRNKVRLPGGKYVKPGFAAWCRLHDAHGARLAENGREAARALLTFQTPAQIIPAYPEPQAVQPGDEPARLPNDPDQVQDSNTSPVTLHKTAGVDQHWQQKYSPYLWFHFTPAMLAAWYNERHQIQELLPAEQNGRGLATWRGERTASVGLREDGWVDFGASARREDGKPDGGDALELTVRLSRESKPDVMCELGRQLKSEAGEALERAAQRGEQPPPWVQAFMSKAGWEHYHHLREEAGHSDQAITAITEPAPHIGEGVDFVSPDNDTPASQTYSDQEQHQLQDAVQAVSSTNPMQVIAMLEAIKDYGQAAAWAALLIDGEEIIPAGRSNWLQFVWLSQQHDQQRRVYEYVRDRSQP